MLVNHGSKSWNEKRMVVGQLHVIYNGSYLYVCPSVVYGSQSGILEKQL